MAETFEQLHPDDKRAIKRFLTGQIQNILANEHGIGGKKNIAIALNRQVKVAVNQDDYLQKMANAILRARRLDIDKMVTAAVTSAAQEMVADRLDAAGKAIKIHISIAPEVPEDSPEHFGQF